MVKTKNVPAVLQVIPPTSTESARLVVVDSSSGLEFCSIELPAGKLESLLYGNKTTCRLTAHAVGKYLGKLREEQNRTVPYPGSPFDDVSIIRNWVLNNKKEDGWEINPAIRAIDIQQYGGHNYVSYTVFRFVKP